MLFVSLLLTVSTSINESNAYIHKPSFRYDYEHLYSQNH